MNRLTWIAAAALLASVGCGDDDDTTPTDAGTDSGSSNTIVDVAVATASLSTLVDALVKAELDDDLSATGPFTVFAPTNEAFTAAGIDPATMTGAQLAPVLLYHVTSGNVPSTALAEGVNVVDSIRTDELSLVVGKAGVSVTVNDATVTMADVSASNGVVHIIDTVLIPPTDIADMAGKAGLSELVTAVGGADTAVATALTGSADLTVFAPVNQAFTDISSTVSGLSQQQLTDVLLYHVVTGEVLSTALTNGAVNTNLSDGGSGFEEVTIDTTGPTVLGVCNQGGTPPAAEPSNIVATDIKVPNGVIHLIDRVLLPGFVCE